MKNWLLIFDQRNALGCPSPDHVLEDDEYERSFQTDGRKGEANGIGGHNESFR